jgi:hypothetical protein
MYRTWTIAFLLTTLPVAGQDRKTHKDYVPDKKTAEIRQRERSRRRSTC